MSTSARCNPVTNPVRNPAPVPTRPDPSRSTYVPASSNVPNTHELLPRALRALALDDPCRTLRPSSTPESMNRIQTARAARTIRPMTTKPRPVSHQFGPFMVANRKFGKMVPPYFSTGFKQYPVADADLTIELDDKTSRMTATRILAGGILAGGVGAIIGALARKDITKGRLILEVNGDHVQTYEFPAKDLPKASKFVEALAQAQDATE